MAGHPRRKSASSLSFGGTLLLLVSTGAHGVCSFVGSADSVRGCCGPSCGQFDCYLCHYSEPTAESDAEKTAFRLLYQGEVRDRHERELFLRYEYRLADGEKVSWGAGFLRSSEGRLEYTNKKGTRLLMFPADAIILREGTGRPAIVHVPHD